MPLIRVILLALIITIFGVPLSGYVPRRVSTTAGPAFERWSDSAFPIVWRLNTSRGGNVAGSRDVLDAIRAAFQAWSNVATSRVGFTEGSPALGNMTNAAQDGINLISLVPTAYNSDAPSLTVLYTVTTPSAGQFPGQILEADILFNPQILSSTDTPVSSDRFDLQGLAVHEIGHLLGLDHSGVASAVMYPALTRGNSLQRAISIDDIIGISNLYPASGFFSSRGTVQGVVRSSTATSVSGAHVVIVDGSGTPVVSTLSESDGSYLVRGLEPGNYSAYAEPFDQPSGSANPSFTTRFAVSGEIAAVTLNKTGGDNQTGTAGQALTQQLEVTVVNSAGSPQSGTIVRFGGTVVPIQTTTDSQGKARTTAYLGKSGTHTFLATAGASSVAFTATASAAPVSAIAFIDPATNEAMAELTVNEGNTLQTPLRVLDSSGGIRTDVPVSFASLSPSIATVDSAGLIRGVKAGFSTLTVAGGGVVATATITVVQVNAGSAGDITSIAIDNSKRLYLAASANHTILTAANLSATPEIYAGVNQSPGLKNDVRLQAQFRNPAFLAVDPVDGTVYVSDSANNVIRKIQPGSGGRVETFAGTGTAGNNNGAAASATFNNPQGIALDDAGYLWVVDSGNHTIRRIHLTSKTVETIAGLPGNPGSTDGTGAAAQFNSPAGIAFEPESVPQRLDRFRSGGAAPPVTVLVADTGNGTIRRVKAGGEVTTLSFGTSSSLTAEDAKPSVSALLPLSLTSPTGLAVDAFGNIYFSEPDLSQIRVILRNGRIVTATQANTLAGPRALLVAEPGKLLASDRSRSAREIAYGKPEIISVTPSPASGAQVTIKGRNFSPETIVVANGVVVSGTDVKDTETITLTIPALTAPIGLSVLNRGGSQDITPPQLTGFSFTPASIDTTSSSADVTLNVIMTDDLSGARSFSYRLKSPSGNQSFEVCGRCLFFGPASTVTGTHTVTFPRFSEAGLWQIEFLALEDTVGNTRTLRTADIAALGFPTQLSVTSAAPDLNPPQLTGVSFSPGSIDTSAAPVTVTLNVTMSDDLSGARSFAYRLKSPSGNQTFEVCIHCLFFGPAPTVTGTHEVTFPRYSEAGAWRIDVLILEDAAGNLRTLNADAIATLGLPTLTVTSNPSDTTPPTLSALSFSPNPIDTTSASVDVTLNLVMADELSGARSFSYYLKSPSGNQSFQICGRCLFFGPGASVAASHTITFARFSETGFWRFQALLLEDTAGNTRTLGHADIAALGFNAELYVIDPATRPAVTGMSVSSGAQSATLSAILSGTNLAGASSISFSGSGVSASIGSGGSATSLPINITISPGAAIGSRAITVRTATGISIPFSGFTVTPQ